MSYVLGAQYLEQVVSSTGPVMRSLTREAATCRETAKKFVGKPEAPFLLQMANAFDELALIDAKERSLCM
jgi:hypothetical protein